MLGKIVQLLGIPVKDGFRVEEGVEFCRFGTANMGFATLTLGYNPHESNFKVKYCWDFSVIEEQDLYKEILVNNLGLVEDKPKVNCIEETLWVIIPYAAEIKTKSKKIAGRYPQEALLEMKVGDTVTVNKAGGNPEIYMAVQAKNEMFLVKKNR